LALKLQAAAVNANLICMQNIGQSSFYGLDLRLETKEIRRESFGIMPRRRKEFYFICFALRFGSI